MVRKSAAVTPVSVTVRQKADRQARHAGGRRRLQSANRAEAIHISLSHDSTKTTSTTKPRKQKKTLLNGRSGRQTHHARSPCLATKQLAPLRNRISASRPNVIMVQLIIKSVSGTPYSCMHCVPQRAGIYAWNHLHTCCTFAH